MTTLPPRRTDASPRMHAGVVLALSVFGISWAAPLIRLSSAPALVIAGWRLVIAESLLLALLLARGDWRSWRRLSRGDHLIAGGAGFMLALHFWSWNASLAYTTVAASVVLVNLQPALVALGSLVFLRESATRRQLTGLAVGMLGALLVAAPALLGEASATGLATRAPLGLPPRLFGDLLALVGAVTAALYYLAGRRLRATLDLVPYVSLVYGWCTLAVFVLALLNGDRLGPYPPRDWAIFAGLAAGPMLIGHTGMNWALKHLPAHVVNLTVLGEPVGASLLAMLIPAIGEWPDAWTLAGGALILGGALWALGQSAGRRHVAEE
ncbi:MAG: DMT family transporter [Gemmatimonadaceae bacterium]|nr:DMT family transporter [Gemmatimonadaceae bacterium]